MQAMLAKNFKTVFMGDSMMERWLNTGKHHWTNNFSDCANLGVGGDGIQHLLYRINGEEVKSILDVIKTENVVLMIGTNNLAGFACMLVCYALA
jgi:hypothetical protein